MSTNISKNIFWLTASRVLALVFLFVAYTRLFRYLGPYFSGQYQFVLSYVLIFATIVDFGIQQFITKKISEEPENAKKYFQDFFSFEILASLSLYVVLVALAYFKGYDREVFYAICVAGLGLVANALTYPYLAVMAAFQDMRKVALINFLNSLVNIAVIFSAIVFHKHIVFLASVQLLFGLLDLVLYRIFVTKHLPEVNVLKAITQFELKPIWGILKQGWPFALLVGFSAIYNRIDVLLITFLKGYEQTGFYTAAYKIFDLLGFFPSVVSYTLFPFFAGLMSKKALSEVRVNLEKYLKLMILAAVPMAVGGSVLSAKLISLIAGPEYAPAAAVLAILIWAPAILFIYIPANALVISQLTKKALMVTGANVVINTVGNFFLIPHFGIKAAAIMTVISELIQGTFYFYFIRKNIVQFSFSGLWIKPILAAVIMGVGLWQIREYSLLVSLPVGAGIYLLVLIITGFLGRADILTIKNLFRSPQS
ncbi:MAG: flippase [Candidatus Doudnabacteria bacterium]|jgi:O-antigen/teichoic acid export membrane protein